MKGFMKKAAALFLIAVMAVTAFVGCSKDSGKKTSGNNADSMFALLKEAGELEKKSFETTMELDADGTKIQLTLSGVSDGKATSVDIKASASGMTYEFTDVIVFTDDVLYINAGSILEQVSPFLTAYGIDASTFGDLGWVYLELEGAFTTTSYDKVFDILDEAYADLIKNEDSEFKIAISEKDDIQAFVDATTKMLKDNKDTFVDMYLDTYNKVDVEAILNNFADELVDAIAAIYSSEITDDMKEELKEELLADTDFSELEVSESDIEEMLDELITELQAVEITEDLGGTVNVKVSKSGDSYVTAVDFDFEDAGESVGASIKSTVTADKNASVEIPSDAKSIVDVIVDVIVDIYISLEM